MYVYIYIYMFILYICWPWMADPCCADQHDSRARQLVRGAYSILIRSTGVEASKLLIKSQV